MLMEMPLMLQIENTSEDRKVPSKNLYDSIDPPKRVKYTESGIISIPSIS